MDIRVILLLCAEALFALFLLYRSGNLKKPSYWAVSVLLLALAFVSRAMVFDYETLDYQDFLTHWVDFFRFNGGFAALDTPVGNYNIPYLYFMALFSYSGIKDLYLIKLLSVFFDVVLAYGSMMLLGKYAQSPVRRLACFFTVLFLPTVFLNGAVWGQCDSIYVSLAVMSIVLALDGKPVRAMIFIALSFGFKLQAVFLMPVFAVLLIAGKVKLRHFLVFPVTYVILVLPAVIAGRPFWDTLTLYFGQTGSIGDAMSYSASSLFAIVDRVQNTALASRLAILAAFLFMLLVIAAVFFGRKQMTNRVILGAAVLFAIGIPFLLPHMHDRYFFAADIMAVVMTFAAFEFFPAALLVQFGSLLGYYAYFKTRFLLPMRYGGWAMLIALCLAGLYFLTGFEGKTPDNGKNGLDKI